MLLSIIIPSYNHENFVLSTIRAAERIDVAEKEIVVIDDGSKDSSARIIRDYIEQSASPCIRLVARENRGLVQTLNEALSMAQGEYLYAVASDDIPIPEGIARMVRMLEAAPSLNFLMGNALVMYSEEQTLFKPAYVRQHHRFFQLSFEDRRRELYFGYPDPLLIQATVFRRSTLVDIGGWRRDLALDDYSLFISLLTKYPKVGTDFDYRPEINGCLYRQHPGNAYRDMPRLFAMVEDALMKQCPSEWREAAVAKKAAFYCLVAARKLRTRVAIHFLHRTIKCVGFLASIKVLSSELYHAISIVVSKADRTDRLLIKYLLRSTRTE